MTKQTSADNNFLSFEQAQERILAAVEEIKTRRNASIREALGRILADDVTSPLDVPPFINSAMDGYAMIANDLPEADKTIDLKMVGKSFAGQPFDGTLKSGECIRIMTGAVVPAGADTVIMQEDSQANNNTITIGSGHKPGQNVRHPGDDFSCGDVILTAGERLSPAKLGLLASVGVTELNIIRSPVVAFFSTGDELKGVGQTLMPGDIYDSNRYILFGMLKTMGVDIIDMGVIPDIKDDIEKAIIEATACADMVITSGGASVGEADYIKVILDEIGAVDFWKIAMKPGKPLAFGKVNNTLFFGLPGNPVSAMATFYQFVQPSLKRLEGENDFDNIQLQARCVSDLRKQAGRKDFQRGVLSQDKNGELIVDTTGIQGSHMLRSMSIANCFIVLDRESGNIKAGETVNVQPFNELI